MRNAVFPSILVLLELRNKVLGATPMTDAFRAPYKILIYLLVYLAGALCDNV